MKRSLLAGLACLAVCAATRATCAPAAGTEGESPATIVIDGKPLRYFLYVPSSEPPPGGWPLLVSLHGAMFTGKDYLARWKPRMAGRFAVLCPTYTPEDSGTDIWGHWWTESAEKFVLAAADQAVRDYAIDPRRVMLMGMSNGGVGAYYMAIRNPARFAAVAPMAGQLPPELWDRLADLLPMGVYLIHGVHDQVMPVEDTDRVYKRLQELGAKELVYVRHEWTDPAAGGHFFPRQALPALIEWLDARRR